MNLDTKVIISVVINIRCLINELEEFDQKGQDRYLFEREHMLKTFQVKKSYKIIVMIAVHVFVLIFQNILSNCVVDTVEIRLSHGMALPGAVCGRIVC